MPSFLSAISRKCDWEFFRSLSSNLQSSLVFLHANSLFAKISLSLTREICNAQNLLRPFCQPYCVAQCSSTGVLQHTCVPWKSSRFPTKIFLKVWIKQNSLFSFHFLHLRVAPNSLSKSVWYNTQKVEQFKQISLIQHSKGCEPLV